MPPSRCQPLGARQKKGESDDFQSFQLVPPRCRAFYQGRCFEFEAGGPRRTSILAYGGIYTDVGEPFLGVDLLMRISDTRWFFNPSLEYVFVDPGDLATVNLDVHYDLDTDNDDLYVGWVAVPAIVFRDDEGRGDDEDDTDVGINLLGGIGWQLEAFVPLPAGEGVDRG